MEYYQEVLEIYISEASHYKIFLPLFNGVYLEKECVFHLLPLNILIRRKKESLVPIWAPINWTRP